MNESDKIKDAIWKCVNRVSNLEEDKAEATAEIAAINKELFTLARNIKRMNVELVAAYAVEAEERKAKRKAAAEMENLSFERKFIINASRMLNRETYRALVDASVEAEKAEA